MRLIRKCLRRQTSSHPRGVSCHNQIARHRLSVQQRSLSYIGAHSTYLQLLARHNHSSCSALNPMRCTVSSTRAVFLQCFFSMCAGKWSEAWECVAALQGIRPLRTVCNALTLTLDDLSSIIDGAARGLADVKEVLEQDRSQRHPHMSLSATA